MNKKFKLIKEYPNSVKLGTILSFDNNREFRSGLRTEDVEKYSEFWEEQVIKQENFKILSFKNPNNGNIYPKYDDNYYLTTVGSKISTETCLRLYQIYSVQNLYGHLFTIGDTIEHIESKENKGKIYKFDYSYGSMMIVYYIGKYHQEEKHNFWNDIDYVKISPIPLFITEDKVEIFENDKAYTLNKKSLELVGPTFYSGNRPDLFWYFSNKENVETFRSIEIFRRNLLDKLKEVSLVYFVDVLKEILNEIERTKK